jgi:hypothetical protein
MTKKRLGLVLLGLVLVVAGLVVGANMQAPATAQEAFRGHFRIRIDDKGVLSCWRDTSGTPCPAKVVPKESLGAATMTSIS